MKTSESLHSLSPRHVCLGCSLNGACNATACCNVHQTDTPRLKLPTVYTTRRILQPVEFYAAGTVSALDTPASSFLSTSAQRSRIQKQVLHTLAAPSPDDLVSVNHALSALEHAQDRQASLPRRVALSLRRRSGGNTASAASRARVSYNLSSWTCFTVCILRLR